MMVGGSGVDAGADDAAGADSAPALEVIVLGSGGGPDESNTTAFLVRSLAAGWMKGSIVAVDAGVHLSAINRILEATQPAELSSGEISPPHVLQSGPFKGLELPHATPTANAAHVLRTLVDTYLITHPHLDHIAGFVINTAGLPGIRPKRLAGLPSTIAAFKAHIFNNVIWPNLTDENNGAGLVTYNRLVEGGSPALGDGEGRGYLEISDGLAVKVWGVSHGHCIEKHSHRGSGSSTRFPSFDASSMVGGGGGSVTGGGGGGVNFGGLGPASGLLSPRSLAHHNTANPSLSIFLQQQAAAAARGEASTPSAGGAGIGGGSVIGGGPSSVVAAGAPRPSMSSLVSAAAASQSESGTVCVYDSSAYFIRDVATGREVLIFGDVEPDTVSLSPRNGIVWAEAAPKIAAGNLSAVFIECSYDDSQSVDRLFGHMTPRYINQEMVTLAAEVAAHRALMAREGRKRKRGNTEGADDGSGGGCGGVRAGSTGRKKTSSRPRYNSGSAASGTGSLPGAGTGTGAGTGGGGDDPVSPKTVKPVQSGTGTGSPADEVPMLASLSSQSHSSQPHTTTHHTHPHPLHALPHPHHQSHGHAHSHHSHHHPHHAHATPPSDSPRLATPTAELSLKDAADLSVLSSTGTITSGLLPASSSVPVLDAAPVPQASMPPPPPPLAGLKVVIIHVKDRMDDGAPAGELIMEELRAHEEETGLGCEYVLSAFGQELYF